MRASAQQPFLSLTYKISYPIQVNVLNEIFVTANPIHGHTSLFLPYLKDIVPVLGHNASPTEVSTARGTSEEVLRGKTQNDGEAEEHKSSKFVASIRRGDCCV